jgi:hypothetical protein
MKNKKQTIKNEKINYQNSIKRIIQSPIFSEIAKNQFPQCLNKSINCVCLYNNKTCKNHY